MIVREFYRTREDGINLYVCYSDQNVYIHKEGSPIKHEKVVQVENSSTVYLETDVKIKDPVNRAKQED
jgi:hypothetical protein